jgi:hypothetical protein
MAFVSAFLSSLPASICVGRITSMSLIDEASFARIHLIDLIFGEQGILNSADTFQFEEWCSQLLTNASTPDFNNYFERTLNPKLELNYKNLGREGLNAANRRTNNRLVHTDSFEFGNTTSMAFVSAFLSSLPASICVGRITSMSLIDEASFALMCERK